jgi:hypothetical protein
MRNILQVSRQARGRISDSIAEKKLPVNYLMNLIKLVNLVEVVFDDESEQEAKGGRRGRG